MKSSWEDRGIPSPKQGLAWKALIPSPFPGGLGQRGTETHLGKGKARCYRACQSPTVHWSAGSRSQIH